VDFVEEESTKKGTPPLSVKPLDLQYQQRGCLPGSMYCHRIRSIVSRVRRQGKVSRGELGGDGGERFGDSKISWIRTVLYSTLLGNSSWGIKPSGKKYRYKGRVHLHMVREWTSGEEQRRKKDWKHKAEVAVVRFPVGRWRASAASKWGSGVKSLIRTATSLGGTSLGRKQRGSPPTATGPKLPGRGGGGVFGVAVNGKVGNRG